MRVHRIRAAEKRAKRRALREEQPKDWQLLLFTAGMLWFFLKSVIGGALVRCSNGNRGISSGIYGKFIYSCLIQYLLNDLYSGIKKEQSTKS